MKRTLLLIPLMAGVSLWGQGNPISVPITQFELDNGLNVILHEDHTIPVVSVNMWYHVGSGREKQGRTGFAHLFEHIMFEGSAHVPEGMFDIWLEGAGGDNNGSTTEDRTNYWENIPANALELALFLESDRMGYLLDVVSPERVDGQRDVVKNERRQRVENRPYGQAFIRLSEMLFPAEHPYSWPVIGYMQDLTAASHQDVTDFFRQYYGPNNASLAIAGDIDVTQTRALVEHWFGDIPRGPEVPPIETPDANLMLEKRDVLEDKVQLPRLYMTWTTPPFYQPGDVEMDILAQVLAGGKNSRLYKRLVYDLQIAQDVSAFQNSMQLGSAFYIIATARSGHTLAELEAVIQEELELIMTELPTDREVERAVNQYEASFLRRLERVGGFGGKADQLNRYFFYTGQADYFNQDLARYRAVSAAGLTEAAKTFLWDNSRVVLSIVPEGRLDLAAPIEQ